ncbi:MAG: LppM family (lipo)protein [Natronosporangium sp.]
MRTRTTPARALPVLGAVTLLVLALTGCLKIDGDLAIEGGTVSGTLLTVMEKDAAAQLEMNPEDVFAGENDRFASLDGVTTAPFDDGTWAGTELTFDQVTIDDVNQLSDGDPDGLRIIRDEAAGTYEFNLVMDLTFMSDLAEDPPPDGEPDFAELLETFEATIAVTFPGEVTEHNGELSGTTVTWTPPAEERTELRAVAEGAEGGGDGDPGGDSGGPEASAAPGDPTGSPGSAPGDQDLTSGSGGEDGSSTVPLVVGLGLAALVAAAAAGWWFFLRPRRTQLAEESGNPAADAGNQPADPDVE